LKYILRILSLGDISRINISPGYISEVSPGYLQECISGASLEDILEISLKHILRILSLGDISRMEKSLGYLQGIFGTISGVSPGEKPL
jgi:hypothetical protein